MDIVGYFADWAPNRYFDNDEKFAEPEEFFTNTNNPLAEKLEVAYIERIERYQQQVEAGMKQIRWGNYPWSGKYTAVRVDFPGGIETIVFDEELDARLMEIYVLYGWDGILSLEAAIKFAQEKMETKFTEPWFVVIPFYLFTRNRLILLIRQALIEIEKKAAHEIITRLNLTFNQLAADHNSFDFQGKSDETKGGAEGGPGNDQPTDNEMGNRLLANELYSIFTKNSEALALQEELLNQLRQMQQFENELRVKTMTTDVRQRSEMQERLNAYVQANKYKQADITRLTTQVSAAIADIKATLANKAPSALLALPLLKEIFTQSKMESAIYTCVSAFMSKIENLGKNIDPLKGRVQIDIPGIREDQQVSASEVEGLYKLGYYPEAEWVQNAIDKAAKDHPYLVLLSEATLIRLIENQTIHHGTLEHIVCSRYIAVLIEKLEEKRASEEKWKAFFDELAKLSAELSIAGLILSPTPFGASASAASIITAIPAMIYQVYSVVHQIGQLDEALSMKIIDANAGSMELLVVAGELIAMRAEYAQQITETILTEIILLRAAKSWGAVKRILHLRGYYFDLKILLTE